MTKKGIRYSIGGVGNNSAVIQGQYLNYVEVNLQNTDDIYDLLSRLNSNLSNQKYKGPLLRRLEPLVLTNRANELQITSKFFEQSSKCLLFILGLAGIGKSTFVRGILEFKKSDTPVIWVTCDGADVALILTEINAVLGLKLQQILTSQSLSLQQKINATLSSIKKPAILVLDGLEIMLNSKGQYLAKEMAILMSLLENIENRVKVLVTSREPPDGVGKGNAQIESMYLRGLDEEDARFLFQNRAGMDYEQTAISDAVFSKIGGHPKFVEMLASSINELPIDRVIDDIVSGTDIGKFVKNHILPISNNSELQVIRAASVFRSSFTFDALDWTYNIAYGSTPSTEIIRTLVRRAIIEINTNPNITYYLHDILRDAILIKDKEFARLHLASASWFLKKPFNANDPESWEDILYHLRKSAEIGKEEDYFEVYFQFVADNYVELRNAGWLKRLETELNILSSLSGDLGLYDYQFTALFLLGSILMYLVDYSAAENIYRHLVSSKHYIKVRRDKRTRVNLFAQLANAILPSHLDNIDQERINEVRKIVDLIEPDIDKTDPELYDKYIGLHFDIARKTGDLDEMLKWGNEMFHIHEEAYKKEQNRLTKFNLSEAHLSLVMIIIKDKKYGNYESLVSHLTEYLRLKLELGNIVEIGWALRYFNHFIGASALLVYEQINLETTLNDPLDSGERKRVQDFLKDSKKILEARETIAKISKPLVPYYDRALSRYGNEN